MTESDMTSAVPDSDLINDVQYNCDISDARDHGIYSLCTMVLKLRNLYKWERGLQPWEEPESVDLLNWIEAKENYWETIADESFRPLSIAGRQFAPLDLEDVNATLNGTLLYGAGFGRSMKTVFFLAEKLQQRTIEGCPVVILGTEQAREMASPFAMVQDGLIILRKQPLRTFLWDQIQEARSSCKVSLRLALKPYGLLQNGGLDQELFKGSLDAIVDQEMDLFLYHEVGEILQGERISEALRLPRRPFPRLGPRICRPGGQRYPRRYPPGRPPRLHRQGAAADVPRPLPDLFRQPAGEALSGDPSRRPPLCRRRRLAPYRAGPPRLLAEKQRAGTGD